MRLTPEQIAKIRQKEAQTPDALKRNPLNDYTEGWFHVTLNTRGDAPVLGYLAGNPEVEDGSENAPRCVLTKLGKKVEEVWKTVDDFHPMCKCEALIVMPEHLHTLLHLLPGNIEHLGSIINGLMIGGTHCYWDSLGIPWREMRKEKDAAASTKEQEKELRAQWQDRDHTRSFRGPALMVRGYNDVEAVGKEEIEIKRQYIRNNPRKRLITRSKPDRFKVVRNGRSKNWTLARVLAAIAADPWIGRNPEKCRMLQDNVIRHLKKSLSPTYPSSLSSTLSPTYPSTLSSTLSPTYPSSLCSTLSPTYPSTSSPAIHRNEEGVKGTHITSRQVPEVTLYLDYVGNRALLSAERKVSLICHRADAALFEKQKAAVMKAAREGAVVVSAFVSPKERDIMKQLMLEQLPFIELMDNGFSDRYKPGGKAFYSVAENRHVQMTCWEYQYLPEQRNENGEQLPTISREMCLVMNELARIISGVEDDWWK